MCLPACSWYPMKESEYIVFYDESSERLFAALFVLQERSA
jgi:hypothetical protein